jgi:Amt family ammonium transporter
MVMLMAVLDGDTAFVLVSAALVMLMTPGLAYFYGGLLRKKNILSMLLWCMVALAVGSVIWVLFGYSLAFNPYSDPSSLGLSAVGLLGWAQATGTDLTPFALYLAFNPYSFGFMFGSAPFIGGLGWTLFNGVGQDPFTLYSATTPHLAYAIFQCMFACITVALIFGAFAERIKFSSFLIFMIVWFTVVYCPVAHWVWSAGGWLRGPSWFISPIINGWLTGMIGTWLSGLGLPAPVLAYVTAYVPQMASYVMGFLPLGVLDFAGGTVVHINAGFAALAGAIVSGKRKGFGKESMVPHNTTYVVLGTALLWFGWFGFNSGSALAANGLAANAFVVTNTAAAAAAVSWLAISWITRGRPSIIGMCTGAVVGLVAITPASGFVNVPSAIIIGLVVSPLSYGAIKLKDRFHLDDSLDVWACHGVGGVWGALATGIFASVLVNASGSNGLLFGNPMQLMIQAFSVVVVAAFSFVATLVILKIIDIVIGLRVTPTEEAVGLDLAQQIEEGYGG